ncbi:MAG: AAA family ATPase [Patescibacteria group bacterium]|nr:AAA family ATPase [Patescibacteria group bacterium]
MPNPPALVFEKAVKRQEKLRMALDGPPGGGKTWTALIIATELVKHTDGRVALIDSERSSARKYGADFDFDHLTLPDNSPHTYIAAVRTAVKQGYSVVIVDSLSHAWEGTLDLKDKVTKRQKSQNSFTAWREVTPVHEELVDILTRAPAHVIVTLRTKMDYLLQEGENGKVDVKKVGLAPIQRQGVEYEFDVVCDLDVEHTLTVSKSRCSALADAVIRRPDAELAERLWTWLAEGEEVLNAEQVAEILAVLDSVKDRQARIAAKEVFRARYGTPEEVRAAAFDDAMALARSLSGVQAPAPPADGSGRDDAPPHQGAPEPSTGGDEGPSETEVDEDEAREIAGAT